VGAAQPDWSSICCFLTSSIGYALFWKGNSYWTSSIKKFVCAAIWFGAIQGLHVNWLTSTHYIGPLVLLGYLLIIVLKGVQFGIISLMVAKTRAIFAIAALWVLMEWSCLLCLFSGYAFDPVGLALSASLLSSQLASIAGVLGLSFWVIATNLFVLRGKRVAASLAILLPFLYGVFQVGLHSGKMEEKSTVLLVQPALSPEMRYPVNPNVKPFSLPDQWRRMLSMLSAHLGEEIDLIVFPEAAVPGPASAPFFEKAFAQAILSFYFPDAIFPSNDAEFVGNNYFAQTIANTFGARVIIGLEESQHNVACLLEPHGSSMQTYSKQQLVPFGEYMPFFKILKLKPFRKIVERAYSVGSLENLLFFSPGREATVLGGDLGLSICYEEVHGGLMMKSRRNGAKMHVNISNDGWFPKSRLPVSHYFHGKLRSVEQGVPLLRACNTGVTCGLDSLGRRIAYLPYETGRVDAQPAILKLDIPLHSYKTLYAMTGNRLIVFLSTLFLLILLKNRLWSTVSSLWKRANNEL